MAAELGASIRRTLEVQSSAHSDPAQVEQDGSKKWPSLKATDESGTLNGPIVPSVDAVTQPAIPCHAVGAVRNFVPGSEALARPVVAEPHGTRRRIF